VAETAPEINGFVVFDVESVGLHGEGFAVALLVLNRAGTELLAVEFACPREKAQGNAEGRRWIDENVPPITINCETPRQVRDAFWDIWEQYRTQNMLLTADNAWPVEARFLIACVEDAPEQREANGPHPLVDIGSALLACDPERKLNYDRLPKELPEHEPLADARRSARLLRACLHNSGFPHYATEPDK
jgi:hypothetical protein